MHEDDIALQKKEEMMDHYNYDVHAQRPQFAAPTHHPQFAAPANAY